MNAAHKMNVLIVGGGGREHALAWKVGQSSHVKQVYVAPGNAGTFLEPNTCNVPIDAEDVEALLAFALKERIDLTIVGPEVPLTLGIVDQFQQYGLPCFGPSAQAAQLEGSKDFTKKFLLRHDIPTAEFQTFEDLTLACEYIKGCNLPVVIKADGLAAGKGVIVAQTMHEAESALNDMLCNDKFGSAGKRIVIEQFLQGEEASYICIVDGQDFLPLAASQDHKAVFNGDTGPNTGGMGAYSPAPIVDRHLEDRILNEIIRPTVRGLQQEGIQYTGFLYAGLMIDESGNPSVLEFNCRLGDPETQPILFRLQSDLLDLIVAALDGKLESATASWDTRSALGVVVAADGYPGAYSKGQEIAGLDALDTEIVKVFHAGTALDENGRLIANGGRVLCVTASAENVSQAQAKAYEAVAQISMQNMHYRTDIGSKALNRRVDAN